MKFTKILLWCGIALPFVVGGWLLITWMQTPASTSPDYTNFPGRPSVEPSASESVTSLQLQSGVSVNVKDFINNGVTISDVVNPGNYILSGPLGYCLGDGSCPAATQADQYQISYYQPDNFFNVALLQEPLTESRLAAESFLKTDLGLSEDELCQLKYTVQTSSLVNPLYAGQNLRFSFCSGSVALE